MGKQNVVPKDWLNCPPNARELVVHKFMALKTPLSQLYDNKVSEEKRFYPDRIFKLAERNNVKFGLWIDLTMTDRYYNKEDVQKMGCEYVKLAIKGHGECPSQQETRKFINIVDKTIKKSTDTCIAVHCTHGFNRTGFLIISFLVECLRISVVDSYGLFKKARPPGIYRANYIKELFRRYGDVSCTPPAPTLPDWVSKAHHEKSINKKPKKKTTKIVGSDR